MRHEVEVDVEAPPEVVWSVVGDPTQWPMLSDSFLKVEQREGDGLAVGSVYLVRQPNIRAMPWTVTACEPGTGFTWRASVPGVTTTGSHQITPRGDASRLLVALDQTGLLSRAVWAMGGAHYRALVDREAATFAGAAEHRAR